MRPLERVLKEIEESLWGGLLNDWFPGCLRPKTGYHQRFSHDWTPLEDEGRFIVFQSRMTWVASKVAETGDTRYPEYARHGLRFLADRMFVEADGSFRWTVTQDGRSTGDYAEQRHAYGSAFAIYALAAVARALQSEEALTLAQGGFTWLESLHDDQFGGYFECADTAGRPILAPPWGLVKDGIGTVYGHKSQNTHLHLLEAFTELHAVWPNPLLERRLRELMGIFLHRLYVEPGYLHCFVEPDWRPVPGTISHGHDVEAAHLILAAARALGSEDDPEVSAKTQALIDYALQTGWDDENGGFFYSGDSNGQVLDRTKNWWVQAEGLLGLATMLERTGDQRYANALSKQWSWVRDFQIDQEQGGWWANVDQTGQPLGSRDKGDPWKDAYHDGRALLNTAGILRSLHDGSIGVDDRQ